MPDAPQKLTPNTWPVGTEVTLMQVPWDANYRDIVIWDDAQQRNAYLDAQALSGTGWRSSVFHTAAQMNHQRARALLRPRTNITMLWCKIPCSPWTARSSR